MLILQLVEQVSRLAEGQTVTLALPEPDLAETVAAWCNRTGNTLVAADARAVAVRRGRLPDLLADLARQRRPGTRLWLWLYTNFDCNLACSYCCVRSEVDEHGGGAGGRQDGPVPGLNWTAASGVTVRRRARR
jgi:hypothetical protein